ncbi:DUF2637 domain-containing protein [Kitasatospora sp. NPDC058063]|uniref:DUF2637 domain-containing protein n=1 Tax=unclassified Kitasatospora TaxID=2633591 RepID=UPI0036DC733B
MTVTTLTEAGEAVPVTAPADSVYDPAQAGPDTQQARDALRFSVADWVLAVLATVVAVGVSGIGLASSYNALEEKAKAPAGQGGWDWTHPWMLPVGLDLSILGFSLLNLVLIRVDRPARWVRWVPRAGAAVTIWLNWDAAGNTGSRVGHAVLAGLWVVFSEVAAHVYAAQLDAIHQRPRMEGARLSRWFMDPIRTAKVVRLMLLWEITSYTEALELFRRREVYRHILTQRHGKKWKKDAPTDALMAWKLARLGLTIEEGLDVPADVAAADALRAHEAGERKRALALRLQEEKAAADLAAVERQAEIDAARMKAEAKRLLAEAELTKAQEEARTAAEAVVRQHELELQVQQAKTTAENERLLGAAKAEAAKAAALADAEASEIRRKAEDAEVRAQIEREQLQRQAVQSKRQAEAEDVRREQEAASAAAQAQAAHDAELARLQMVRDQNAAAAAEAARKKAVAVEEAAVALESASVIRAQAVVAEAEAERLAAVEKALAAEAAASAARLEQEMAEALEAASVANDAARRTPAERQALIVADMIGRFGEKAVTISYIVEKLGLPHGTAQDRRDRARVILEERAAAAMQPA